MNVATCNIFGRFVIIMNFIYFFFFVKKKKSKKIQESIIKSNVAKIKPKYVLKIPPKKLIKS